MKEDEETERPSGDEPESASQNSQETAESNNLKPTTTLIEQSIETLKESINNFKKKFSNDSSSSTDSTTTDEQLVVIDSPRILEQQQPPPPQTAAAQIDDGHECTSREDTTDDHSSIENRDTEFIENPAATSTTISSTLSFGLIASLERLLLSIYILNFVQLVLICC